MITLNQLSTFLLQVQGDLEGCLCLIDESDEHPP